MFVWNVAGLKTVHPRTNVACGCSLNSIRETPSKKAMKAIRRTRDGWGKLHKSSPVPDKKAHADLGAPQGSHELTEVCPLSCATYCCAS